LRIPQLEKNYCIMKILKLFLVAFVISGVISCKKGTLVSANVSMDDAAAMLGGSLSSSSYGMNNMSADVSLNAGAFSANNSPCGFTKIDTFSRHISTPSVTYAYKLSYTHKLFCNTSNLPDNITSSLTFGGYYSNSKVLLTNTGTLNYVIAGLTPTATVYVLNGEYKSSGTFKLKSDTTNTGSASIDIVVKNVTITKATQVIASGTATVIITGTTSKKGDFTYNGTLTFNGASMATMIINGTTYTVNLLTGDITKK